MSFHHSKFEEFERKENRKYRQKTNSIETKQVDIQLATNIAFVTLAETGSIDEITASEHTEQFIIWQPDTQYKAGNLRVEDEILYKCLQNHTSQVGWEPKNTPALWRRIDKNNWSQPLCAGDGYALGDVRTHKGKQWRSLLDDNCYEPGTYGWEEV